MSKEYVPIFFEWLEVTQDLTAEEKGNLIDAVVAYASGQPYEHLLTGGVRIAFRFLKGQVDRNNAISEARSKAGSNKPEQKETKPNKPEQSETNSPKENNKEKEKEKEKEKQKESSSSFVDADDAAGILSEQNQVLDAAESAGFGRTDAVRAKLIDLYSLHGLQKMLDGINSCVDYGVTTIAYLTAVLNGKPKNTKAGKVVSAQQYDQRDYAGEEEQEWERTIAHITAEKARTG